MTNIEKGKLLREVRKRLRWTQKRMAKEIGLDPTYLSQLENGHPNVDDYYLVKVKAIADEVQKVKAAPEPKPAAPNMAQRKPDSTLKEDAAGYHVTAPSEWQSRAVRAETKLDAIRRILEEEQ